MHIAAIRRRALGVGLLAMLASSPGQTYMVSAFHESWSTELDLSKTQLGFWYALGSILASVCLVAVGRVSDRRGPRFTLAAVALALGAGCVVMAGAAGGASLALGFFLIRLFGQGSMGLVSGHALALAYDEGLGKAEGLRVGAISVAVGLAPFCALFLIGGVGWRWTYVILGGIVVAVIVPAAQLLPRHGQRRTMEKGESDPSTEGVSLGTAVRSRAYVATGLVVMLHAATVTAVHFHSQPLFAEYGFGQESAAAGMSVFAICMLLASLTGGWFVDRTAWHVPFVTSTFFLSSSMLLLAQASNVAVAHTGMGLLGVAQGLGGVAIVPTVARCFGRAHFGAVRGSLATLTVAGASVGPVILGWATDYSGDFSAGLIALALAGPPAALLVWVSLRPARANPAP